jgi:hypothetical protein
MHSKGSHSKSTQLLLEEMNVNNPTTPLINSQTHDDFKENAPAIIKKKVYLSEEIQ